MNNRSKNYDKEKQNGYPGAEDYLTFVPLFGCFIVLAFATQNVNHDCCVGGGKEEVLKKGMSQEDFLAFFTITLPKYHC